MTSHKHHKEHDIYSLEEISRFVKDCMTSLGVPERHAEELAKCLADADYRGHISDGINRLDNYIKEIKEGMCDITAEPEIIKESLATGFVDGKNSLGVIVGNFCMDLAIKKAKNVGIGWIVAKGSNLFGAGAYYSTQALKEGLLGMTFSNMSPLVAPTHSSIRALGTNPISLTAPGLKEDSFVLEISTSAVSSGKIEMLSKQGAKIPEDWADPQTGALHPIGGKDPASNHKGFGLGMLVEIFTGILSGSAYGPHVRSYGSYHQEANLGQCYVAINPEFFAPGFQERLQDLLILIRNLQPITPHHRVVVAGDIERQHMQQVDQQGGISYDKGIIATCARYARKLNVRPLQPLN